MEKLYFVLFVFAILGTSCVSNHDESYFEISRELEL